MSDALKEANQKLLDIQLGKARADPSTVAQQSDNVAHALSGAGGGLLAMALTFVVSCSRWLRKANLNSDTP